MDERDAVDGGMDTNREKDDGASGSKGTVVSQRWRIGVEKAVERIESPRSVEVGVAEEEVRQW